MTASAARLPTLFAAHGGGPLPLLGDPGHAPLTKWLSSWPQKVAKPKALLVISSHWEEPVATVTSGLQPELIYDYYGFPPETYKIKYPAPGSPQLAARVAQLLQGAGVAVRQDAKHGWDHGVFVPLKLMYPAADIPVVALSLLSSLDAKEHLRMGEALAPLRDEGVLVLGSGFTFHNMAAFQRGPGSGRSDVGSRSAQFDAYLQAALTDPKLPPEERRARLEGWEAAPQARFAQPREEHLLPLLVAAGAGGYSPAKCVFNEALLGAVTSSFQFD